MTSEARIKHDVTPSSGMEGGALAFHLSQSCYGESIWLRHLFLIFILIALLLPSAFAQDRSPETIKIGPLKPLETLPSLSASPKPAPSPTPAPTGPQKEYSAANPGPPPLPGNTFVLTGPVAQAYLYIEPYQTRFEVLFDAASMMQWLFPERKAPLSLSPAMQKELGDIAALRAANWCALATNDGPLDVPQPLVALIKGVPGNILPLKENEEVALNQAMFGFMWEFATPPKPQELDVAWKGWFQGVTKLPVKAFFGPLSEAGEIHPAVKHYRWRNMGRLPHPAPLAAVPQFEAPAPVRVPLGSIVWLLVGLAFYIYLKVTDYKLPGGSLPFTAVWLLGVVLMSQLFVIPVSFSAASPKVAQVEDALKIVSPLLRNVYRAFDHHAESDVYDVLARSVDGELLRKLYLETIQALTLDGREGTRVTIAEFSANVDKVESNPKGEGFVADCNWMARGIVGHWGHSHPRVNIYYARVTITPNNGEWKLTGLEVQEVRRL
jgi:hypothetical protein